MLWTSAKLLFSHENTLQQYFTAETNGYNQFQDPYLRKIPKSIFHQHSQHQNTVQVWFILQGSKWVVCGEGYGLYYTLWDQYVYQTTTKGPVTRLKNLSDVYSILLGAVESDFQLVIQKESYQIASDL